MHRKRYGCLIAGFLVWIALPAVLHAQVNSWINPSSGKWEVPSNWSVQTPSILHSAELITNANSKTVSMDSATAGVTGALTVSNLTVAGASGATNTLSVAMGSLSATLHILNGLTLSSGGSLLLTNSTVQIDSDAGVGPTIDGNIWVNGGQLTATNAFAVLGNTGAGQLTVSNGTVQLGRAVFGSNTFSTGTMTLAGGSVIASNLFVGQASNAVGAVWVTGGSLIMTNFAPSGTIIGVSGPGQFTLSNGTVHTYSLLGGFHNAGTVTIAGGTLSVVTFQFGFYPGSTGTLWVTGGQVISTNGGLFEANGVTQMAVSNGTCLFRDLYVGQGLGGLGTFTLAGGTVNCGAAFSSNIFLAASMNSTGTMWITGGQLIATNNMQTMYVGEEGIGQLVVSNGSVAVGNLYCGTLASGTITIAGGSFSVMRNSIVALGGPNLTGTVSVTSGQLVATNGDFVLGCFGNAPLTVSGGTVVMRSMTISSNYSATGSLTIPAGQVTVFDKLVVGDCGTNAIGRITVNGGTLYVTNATHTGYLDLRDGTLTVSAGGVLIADELVMTNTCGLFVRNGGTASFGTLMLATNLSAVGDGIPNGWKQQYGLDPLDPNLASEDLDGSGFTVLQDYLAGLDPNNPASAFRITAITPVGTDIRVYFTSVGGKYYSLQRSDFMGGAWTAIVTNIPGNDAIQWVKDIGAATRTSAFYQILLDQLTNAPPVDSDGDGVPDWWTQEYFGHPTGQAADNSLATDDPDGTGFTVLQDYLAGLDPTNSASSFRIISIAPSGIDLLVTWTMGPNRTNALQATAGDATGNYNTNNFLDIFTVTNTVGTTTNYLDTGAATNFPARYYRVRLIP